MPNTDDDPAEIECDEDGRHVGAFPDFGWGATDGAKRGFRSGVSPAISTSRRARCGAC